MEEDLDVIVVGAGWFGLVAAKVYLQVAPNLNLTILESSSCLGGTWSSERVYSGLRTHNALGGFEISDIAMSDPPPHGTTAEGYLLGEDLTDYLHRLAERFDLLRRIRYGSTVQSVRKIIGEDGGTEGCEWEVHVQEQAQAYRCRKLIIATGLTSRPRIPDDIPLTGEKPIPAFHTIELKQNEPLLRRLDSASGEGSGSVVVYGGSKSAFDAVYLAATAGNHVHWVIRTTGLGVAPMFPAMMLGRPSASVSPMRAIAAMSPCIYSRHTAVSRFLHGTALGNVIVRFWWKIVTKIAHKKQALRSSENGRKLVPDLGDLGNFWTPGSTSGVLSQTDFFDLIHPGERVTVHRAEIYGVEDSRVQLSGGVEVKADAVIWATGWIRNAAARLFETALGRDLGLPIALEDQRAEDREAWGGLDAAADELVLKSFPMLRSPPPSSPASAPPRMTQSRLYRLTAPVNGDRSIAFVGTMHTAGTGVVSEAQALWAVAYLEGRLSLPQPKEMHNEVAAANAWFRRRYLGLGRMCPNITFEYTAFVDALLGDLGLSSRRKPSMLMEWFSPYGAKDYRGLVDEWCAREGLGNNSSKS